MKVIGPSSVSNWRRTFLCRISLCSHCVLPPVATCTRFPLTAHLPGRRKDSHTLAPDLNNCSHWPTVRLCLSLPVADRFASQLRPYRVQSDRFVLLDLKLLSPCLLPLPCSNASWFSFRVAEAFSLVWCDLFTLGLFVSVKTVDALKIDRSALPCHTVHVIRRSYCLVVWQLILSVSQSDSWSLSELILTTDIPSMESI